ncbi:CHAT domain-containing protein [Lewinella sp. LCG006]|uniref:CHAT domain-containing protein n=1 Tax=Lewinella sp. LCG006 TaxID=3231911 RepID=UPI00346143FE
MSYDSSPICLEADQLLAAQNYTAAIQVYSKCLNQQHQPLDQLYTLNQSAYAHLMLYQQKEAAVCLEQAMGIAHQLEDMPIAARADLAFLRGRTLFLDHQFPAALTQLHQAQQLYQEAAPSGHLRQGQVLATIALLHFEYHPTVDSLNYANKAFQFLQQDTISLPFLAEVYFAKAAASLYDRAHERGDDYCKALISTLAALPEAPLVLSGRNLALYGNMLKKQGDIEGISSNPDTAKIRRLYTQADSLMEKAYTLLKNTSSDYWQEALRDWVVMARRFRDQPQLIQTRIALAKTQLKAQEDHYLFPDRLTAYATLGTAPALTITGYEKFLAGHLLLPQCNWQLLDESYFMLREYYRKQKAYAQALHYQREGQVLFGCFDTNTPEAQEQALGHLASWSTSCLNGFAALVNIKLDQYEDTGDLQLLKTATSYLDSLDKYWLKSIVRSDEDAVLSYFSEVGEGIYSSALRNYEQLWQGTGDSLYLDYCFHYAERMKSFLTYRESVGALAGHPSLRTLQANIQGRAAQFEQNNLTAQEQLQLFRWQDELEQILLQWRRDSVSYQLAHQQPTPPLREISQQLLNDQGMLHFTELSEAFYVSYTDRETHRLFTVDKTPVLLANIRTYQTALRTQKELRVETVANYQQSARVLYQAFIQPIAERLAARRRLLVVADGALQQMPFGALIPPGPSYSLDELADAPYLFRHLDIRYAASWKAYHQRSTLVPVSLAGATTVWSDSTLATKKYFNDLHQTIQTLSTGPFLFETQAMANNFLNQGPAEITHLTLHALSSASERHKNQVYFPNDTLYGYDIARSSLPTRLLVLAACETALGDYRLGEGTFHLVRSFQQAGAQEVVATLWQVQQQSTAHLLKLFYQALAEGMAPAPALRQAKLQFLAKPLNRRTVFPGYWAGVVVW